MVERVPDQRLDEIIGCVVRPGGGAFVARFEVEDWRRPPVAREIDRRLVLEKPFIDGTELLDVERGVVDPDELAAVGMGVEPERAEAGEQVGV